MWNTKNIYKQNMRKGKSTFKNLQKEKGFHSRDGNYFLGLAEARAPNHWESFFCFNISSSRDLLIHPTWVHLSLWSWGGNPGITCPPNLARQMEINEAPGVWNRFRAHGTSKKKTRFVAKCSENMWKLHHPNKNISFQHHPNYII